MAGTHSRSRKPRKGARFPEDPDRRVKYVLRFRRKGEEVEPETRLVRRGRRPETRDIAPGQSRAERREQRRRERHEAAQQLTEQRKQLNTQLADEPLG